MRAHQRGQCEHQRQQADPEGIARFIESDLPSMGEYSPENTGMTLVPVKEYPSYVSSTPTTCQMKRPG